MARRRNRLQPGRSRSASTGAVGSSGGGFEAFDDAISAAVEGLAGFTKSTIEGSSEVKRAEAAFKDLSSSIALSSLQDIASSFSSTAGSLVGGFRKGLGNLTAEAAAAQDLEQLAASGAAVGVPYTKDELKDFFGLFEGQEKSIEGARQLAHDVSNEKVKEEGRASLEFLGVPTTVEGWREAGREMAHEIGSFLRETFGLGH